MFENFVYIIKGYNIIKPTKTKYYIGFTNNPQRRIRQHNREITGGAKATKGYKWTFCGIIANFRDNIEGLQIEWRLKYSTKQKNIVKRLNSFFNYIDTNLKSSPNNSKMLVKPFLYVDNNLLPNNEKLIKPNNIIIINVELTPIIIEHVTN
jgi:predicted GIY-YIG superfamily endonuclease